MTKSPTDLSSLSSDELLDRYRAELELLDYSNETIGTYLRVVRMLVRTMDMRRIAMADLTPDRAAELLQNWTHGGKQATYDATIVTPGRYRPDDTLLAFLEAL